MGTAVQINSNDKLGVTPSSARFKQDIESMDKASEAIHALKPVTFRYKAEIDPEGVPQFGLVAEDVEKVNPHLVARDAEGKVYTVRYEAVNAMLLNEFMKEHRKVEQLAKQVEALTAGLQKVSAELETSRALRRKWSATISKADYRRAIGISEKFIPRVHARSVTDLRVSAKVTAALLLAKQ